jgi:hypothetical protein
MTPLAENAKLGDWEPYSASRQVKVGQREHLAMFNFTFAGHHTKLANGKNDRLIQCLNIEA